MTCVGRAQVAHRFANKICGQHGGQILASGGRSTGGCAFACMLHIPSGINDLRCSYAGYSQPYPRKLLITAGRAGNRCEPSCACRRSPSHVARRDERSLCCPPL
jgi:hypothetical protein